MENMEKNVIDFMEDEIDIAPKYYSINQVMESALEYFNDDRLAAEVWVNKYALKDSHGNYYERTPDDMHRRISKEFARVEAKYPNALEEDEIYSLIKGFKYIVPQGSPMAGIGNDFQITSLSNCFVIGNDSDSDSYGGIMKLDQELVQLMKRRAGVGLDLSFIRPAGTPVKNSALTSTGVVPYMERFSNSTREVAQDGRRGALMESISIIHPDSEKFIDAKMDESKVTGANISIRLSDEFMKSAINGEEFTQQFPIDSPTPAVSKKIDANKLWNKVIHNAWKRAEPGILYWDTIIRESIPDCYADLGFKTVSTNPCISGDTLIAVADGRNAVSIKQLTMEGKDVPLYSTDINGQIQIKYGRNPRKTGDKKEVWKLTLDDGSILIATPDHKIYLKNNTYRELKDLIKGDSISPFYSYDSNGYRQISSCGKRMIGGSHRNRRQYRVIHEFHKGSDIDYKKFAIHHIDFNKCNDNIDNLQLMPFDDHTELHAARMRGDKNPYFKFSDEQKFKFASHPGDKNPKYIDISNDDILKQAKILFDRDGKITSRSWMKYAKENNLPQSLWNEFRFKNFANFKNQVANNHKVESVEFHGYEDVYNITVDDNHNYNIITKTEDDNYITSSGICVKNCGEITLCSNDSCRLLVLNLYSYVENPFAENSKFNFDLFKSHAKIAQRLMDDLIDLELEKVDKIIEKIKNDPEDIEVKHAELNLWLNIKKKCIQGRRTGLGITGEGDMIAALGLTYGTDESNIFAEEVARLLKLSAYESSVDLAQERGAFPLYDAKREENNPFLLRIKDESPVLYERMLKYGRRNIALLTIAPTGSVSILTQTTSGVEPAFLISYMRRKKINPNDKSVRVDFKDSVGDCWQEYPVFHHKFLDYLKVKQYDITEVMNMSKEEIAEIIKNSPYHKATSNDVDWVKKVEMQGLLQKHVDHSISVTVNLPNDVTEEVVSKVYQTGWESGCKGITVYRDGSRSGVLVSEPAKKEDEFHYHNAPKRPKELPCDVFHITAKGKKWTIVVGLYDGKPYECFGIEHDATEVPETFKKGTLLKEGRGAYILKNDKYSIADVASNMTDEEEALTRMISTALRHGSSIDFIVDQLNKSQGTVVSYNKAIARVLSKYAKVLDKNKGACDSCGGTNVSYEEGCFKCYDCSFSKCSS